MLVLGLGSIGLLGLLVLQMCKLGGNTVIAADISPKSMALASDLGADFVVDFNNPEPAAEMRRFLGGSALDVVFKNVCLAETLRLATGVVKKNGTVFLVGICKHGYEVNFNIFDKEVLLKSVFLYTDSDFEKAVSSKTAASMWRRCCLKRLP